MKNSPRRNFKKSRGDERSARAQRPAEEEEEWIPKTTLGKKVKSGEIKTMDEILDKGIPLLETRIVDFLLPDLEKDLLLVGQAKGKFGGGKRRVFKQTQKKTKEGNKPKFATFSIIGNKNGFIGIGFGKSKETVPAREKAFRNSKMNIFKIRRGCGSWECMCGEPHSIPFTVQGKCGSVVIKLIPAPKGTGLIIERECAKILELAGIKDIWSQTFGKTGTKMNLIKACEKALKDLMATKIQPEHYERLSILEGEHQKPAEDNKELNKVLLPESLPESEEISKEEIPSGSEK
ncbi:MAG: 30S ribosomal protein S5 [Nanoarchaeota archaeon]|nr:30S ribosomal protein S5 [Nanoarchaeota archaeon]